MQAQPPKKLMILPTRSACRPVSFAQKEPAKRNIIRRLFNTFLAKEYKMHHSMKIISVYCSNTGGAVSDKEQTPLIFSGSNSSHTCVRSILKMNQSFQSNQLTTGTFNHRVLRRQMLSPAYAALHKHIARFPASRRWLAQPQWRCKAGIITMVNNITRSARRAK